MPWQECGQARVGQRGIVLATPAGKQASTRSELAQKDAVTCVLTCVCGGPTEHHHILPHEAKPSPTLFMQMRAAVSEHELVVDDRQHTGRCLTECDDGDGDDPHSRRARHVTCRVCAQRTHHELRQ